MKWLNNITSKDGIVSKITGVVGEAVEDKDKRNALMAQITVILMQSKVAPYVRAYLAILIATGCLFFASKMTISPEAQQYLLYSVVGFYFLDFMKSAFGKK